MASATPRLNSSIATDSFVYQANGSAGPTATVSLTPCSGTCHGAAPTANPDAYASSIAAQLQISPPGVLANEIDPDSHPLTAGLDATSGVNVTLDADGLLSPVLLYRCRQIQTSRSAITP